MGSSVILWAVVVTGGCEDSGIREETVPKGVERLPEAPAGPKVDSGGPVEGLDAGWAVREHWTLDREPRTMRVATFLVPDASGDVEVAITRFQGRVGGELANINRWRGQLGLAAIETANLDESLTRFESPGFAGYHTRIESDAGVMLASGVYDHAADHTWFVRATVPDAAAADRLEYDLIDLARSMAGLTEGGG